MKAQFPEEETESGEFKRQADAFREWISNDGSTPYAAEPGRFIFTFRWPAHGRAARSFSEIERTGRRDWHER